MLEEVMMKREILFLFILGLVLQGCSDRTTSAWLSDRRMPVNLVDKDGHPQPIKEDVWYLVTANLLQQAFPTDSEDQCKQAIAQLNIPTTAYVKAICKQGKDLKSMSAI